MRTSPPVILSIAFDSLAKLRAIAMILPSRRVRRHVPGAGTEKPGRVEGNITDEHTDT
jgi:hypothetical protein